LPDHIARRDEILEALREELLGPSPQGEQLDTAGDIFFEEVHVSYGPYRQLSGEEILMRDRPTKRYGIGVLSPPEVPAEEGVEGAAEPTDESDEPSLEVDLDSDRQLTMNALDSAAESGERLANETRADDYDYELSSVNAYRPSTMAVSFLAELPAGASVVLRASGGRYTRKTVKVAARMPDDPGTSEEEEATGSEPLTWERTWWLRTPVSVEATFDADALLGADGKLDPVQIERSGEGSLELDVVAYPRARPESRQSLLTVCLVNRSDVSGAFDENCLFQTTFSVEVVAPGGSRHILPYPDPESRLRDEEDESFALLYRNYETFATGHGCAADWRDVLENRARAAIADPLPVFEAPNVTGDISLPDGRPLSVPMAALAGLVTGDDGFAALEQLVVEYSAWIERHERLITGDGGATLPERYRAAAIRHLTDCRDARDRINRGVAFLRSNADAMTAFRLANHAILLQQLRVRREPRRASYQGRPQRLTFEAAHPAPDPLDPPAGRGTWRAFQIAFLLGCVQSVADPEARDREDVDLIWFPTGGGKTEAYLGLTAFSLFYRRLRGREDHGVDVLMRYTLRLLTAQQFQRASTLMCAMELLRRDEEHRLANENRLGYEPFTIGIWLGGGVSPNTRSDATRALRDLRRGRGENQFVLMKCPWCSAQMGPIRQRARSRRDEVPVLGYVEASGSVGLRCPDADCEFHQDLPVFVIDEDIYEHRPSLVIGTVDKFAQLAWNPKARALFGLALDGTRLCSPPNLIIQDELHMISGPLGSMVGLYEGLVDALCREGSDPERPPPKIVSSTATVRRYREQIHDLYARPSTRLFPPPGLDASDSFFATYARLPDGQLSPGRKYVGVHGAGLGSVQTAQVRTFASLLQAPAELREDEKDPWWTLMVFFNSLRELGTSLSLLQSDIPDYLRVIQNRLGLRPAMTRRLRKFLELTGRLRNDEVPKAMEELEVETTSTGGIAVDACLASNIIEVGIDIDRLSLMCVVGQPKTTSQYIQVTGRVGRRWWERPALVVTIYSPSKPRDRSHFEKFRSYHERLYAQVEPTSVTPFSPPVLDRALHAVMAGFARQAGTVEQGRSPYPYPAALVDSIHAHLSARVGEIDPEEHERFEETFEKRAAEWERWQRTSWRREGRDGDIGLLRVAGQYATAEESELSWATPNSLRDVDAECRTQITNLYLRDAGEEENV
jgi:hypothetical protein